MNYLLAIQPQGIVKEAKKCSALHGHSRDVEIRNLAEYISDTVSVFSSQEGSKIVRFLWNIRISFYKKV